MGLFDGIDPDRQERIRKEIAREVRRELEGELRASVRRQVQDDVRRESRQEILRELEQQAPSDADRARFGAFVREVELDALAQASLASTVADEAEQHLERSRRWATPAAYLLTLAAPLGSWLASSVAAMSTAAFTAFVATLLLAWLLLVASNLRRHRRLERSHRSHRKIASDFLIVAERAKAYRMVHAERTASAGELREHIEELQRDKERRDRAFHPSAAELDAARQQVRARFDELPPLRNRPRRGGRRRPDDGFGRRA